ncbi:nascent polypeptide-associated complex subunit alpha, muscle-specific form-like isoform X1 [Gadus macrocephalus]|uniref:nascent polypeptide-associated complex subunit alpha, muscle-specific form-like isoform X1 n=1 Tax=Gadus macrocephalus TaxID=80720 RepID=UPI0028CB344B|nr:nascent polypeptide-associated complex subunit alpha, muscle-specific form-like isoform X1 [Gadus macrocephalus]
MRKKSRFQNVAPVSASMSNRDSLGFGDLIPQDVAEVFAQERMSKGGRRKKRSKSLGRAIDWFKGKKRKDADANGQSPGLGPGLDLALEGPPAGPQTGQKTGKPGHSPGSSRAVARQGEEDRTPAPPLIQENVFIESSRPKYIEDLHNEAQEGLKLFQQEETSNGVEFRDDLSSISTVTTQPEDDGQGFLSDSTMADTSSIVSTQSTVSSMSSRSGITRQGSSFRPLNSGKKPEKAKHRRRSRRTVMGIPKHVQRELGLDRMEWKSNPVLDEELDENMNSEAACDAVDRPSQLTEPSVGLHNAQVNRALAKSQTLHTSNAHASHRDDLALLHRLNNESAHRPRSLAVPWLTTAHNGPHGPPSPVMSMNPHAAYMSKIIPNAVMPPSVEVLEIQRGRSRCSQKTVSKSSLLVSSPTGSRASSRASSCRGPPSRAFSSRASSRSSASQQRANYTSDSSGWSRSESSETLVSDSSTISSSTTPQQHSSADERRAARHGSPPADKVSLHSSASRVSNGKAEGMARSLSIMKSKRAPPPPSRSYSLHNRMKRKSRDLTEPMTSSKETSPQNSLCSGKNSVKSKSGEKKEAAVPPVSPGLLDSPGYTADTSSLDDSNGSTSFSPIKSQLQAPGKVGTVKKGESPAKVTTSELQPQQENVLKKTASPSSGYSSQAGTPTHLSKHPLATSPKPKRGFLSKLQGLFPGSSPPKNPTKPSDPQQDSNGETGSASPSVRVLRELFNIPPPPKVHAPPPPPPEVWAHNKRTFELLLGPPAPYDSYAAVKRNPKDRRQQRPSPSISVKSASTEGEKKSGLISAELINGVLSSMVLKKVQESEQCQKENKERLTYVDNCEKVKGQSNVTEKAELSSGSVFVNGRSAEVTEKVHERLAATQGDRNTATHKPTSMTPGNTSVETQSLLFKTPTTRPAVSPPLESLWPPPPPPMDPAAETLLIRQDGTDFPLPPPPLLSEEGLVVLENVPQVEVRLDTSVPHVAIVQGSLNAPSVHTSLVSPKKTPETPPLKTNKPGSTAPKPSPQKIKLILPTPQGYPPPPQSIPPPPPFSAPTLPVNLPANPLLTEGYLPTLAEADSTSTEQLGGPSQEPPPTALLPSALRLTPPKSIPPPPQPKATVSASESVPQPPPPLQKIPPTPGEAALCIDTSLHAASVLPAPTPVLSPVTEPLEAPPVATKPAAGPEVTHSLPSPPINPTTVLTLITKPQKAPPKATEPAPEPEVLPSLTSPPINPTPIITLVPKPQEAPPKPTEPAPEHKVTPSLPSPPINLTHIVTLVPKPQEAPPKATEPALEHKVTPSLPSPPINPTPIVTLVPKPQEAPPKPTEPAPEHKVTLSLPSSSPSQATTDGSQQPCKETKENQSKEQNAAVAQVLMSVVTTVDQPSVNVPSVNKSPEPNRALDLVQPEVVTEDQQPLSQGALESQMVVLKPAPSQPMMISKSEPELLQTEVVIDAQPLTSPPPIQTPTDISHQQAKETPEDQSKEQKATVDVSNSPESSKAQAQVLRDLVVETQQPISQVVLESEAVASQQTPPQPVNIDQAQDLLQPEVVIEAQQPISQDVPEAVASEQAPSEPLNVPSSSAPAPQVPASATEPGTTEGKTVDSTSPPAQEEGTTSSDTPSLAEPVKQKSTDGSPEATNDQGTQDQPVVTMRTRKPESHIQTHSSSLEAPQKPIRRSLIMSSLPTIAPPVVVDSQEAIPKSPSAEVTHISAALPPSPTKKSPPATNSAPSMNMQEAIRLRTAARAKSPTSPRGPKPPYGGDVHKSPSSVASFIFSKNTRKVGTAPVPEAQPRVQENRAAEPAAVSKPVKEDDQEEKKQGVKVPPPVARKPKAQAKDTGTNVGTE